MSNWRSGAISIPASGGGRIAAVYHVKQYDEGSEYGIDGGRISKLQITIDDRKVANYDRGWDIKPETEPAKAALEILLEEFN